MTARAWFRLTHLLSALALAAPAVAQQAPAPPAAASAAAPAEGATTISGIVGFGAVENLGALAGLRVSRRVSSSIAVQGDALWMQDTVTRRTLDLAASVAQKLQTSQGATATADVQVPAWSFTGGIDFDLTHGPSAIFHVFGEAGAARISKQPTFTLGGADVTADLGRYGIVLGEDLTGESTVGAFGAGFGVRMPRGVWVFDAGVSVLSLRAKDDTANVIRAMVAVGRRF